MSARQQLLIGANWFALVNPALLAVIGLRYLWHYTLDPVSLQVTHGGVPISFTPKEYTILETLMRRAVEVVSRVGCARMTSLRGRPGVPRGRIRGTDRLIVRAFAKESQ